MCINHTQKNSVDMNAGKTRSEMFFSSFSLAGKIIRWAVNDSREKSLMKLEEDGWLCQKIS